MRAKGAESKKIIFDKILETFDGAFMVSDKELRIPMTERGEIVEIKVALTRAKDVLGNHGAAAKPNGEVLIFDDTPAPEKNDPYVIAPTPDEKRSVEKMMRALGLINE